MKIKAMKGLRDPEPLVVDGYSLLIVEKDCIPIAVVMDAGPDLADATYVGHARDPEFNAMLAQLGIDKVVIVEDGQKLFLPKEPMVPVEQLQGL